MTLSLCRRDTMKPNKKGRHILARLPFLVAVAEHGSKRY